MSANPEATQGAESHRAFEETMLAHDEDGRRTFEETKRGCACFVDGETTVIDEETWMLARICDTCQAVFIPSNLEQ